MSNTKLQPNEVITTKYFGPFQFTRFDWLSQLAIDEPAIIIFEHQSTKKCSVCFSSNLGKYLDKTELGEKPYPKEVGMHLRENKGIIRSYYLLQDYFVKRGDPDPSRSFYIAREAVREVLRKDQLEMPSSHGMPLHNTTYIFAMEYNFKSHGHRDDKKYAYIGTSSKNPKVDNYLINTRVYWFNNYASANYDVRVKSADAFGRLYYPFSKKDFDIVLHKTLTTTSDIVRQALHDLQLEYEQKGFVVVSRLKSA